MLSSKYVQRWIKRVLAVLAVAQVMALSLSTTQVAFFGKAEGDRALSVAAEGEGGEGTETETGTTEEPPPPASGVVSSETTGDSFPIIEHAIAGTLGNGGWYTSNADLTWTVSDPETPDSLTSEGCTPSTVSADTLGDEFTCSAASDGGTAKVVVKIARDATDPADVSVSTDIEPAASGWFVAPFTATWAGTDATSGIESCTVTPYSGPDTTAAGDSLGGTCTDNAGNESDSVPFAFKYDASAPSVTGTPDRLPDHNGWYNHDVVITWTSSDPDATCDAPTTFGDDAAELDSATAIVGGSCSDPAGNVGNGTFDFLFDQTAPTIALTTPAADGIYILNQPVNADYTCADATSGIDTCTGTVANGSSIDTATVGSKSFAVNSTDMAGNAATPVSHSYAVQYQPVGVDCGGVAGHTILDPIAKRTTSFKQGSSVPAKFRVCDFFGAPVTSDGVVTSFRITAEAGSAADKPVGSRSSHLDFRAGEAQWIYNIDTKPLSKTAYLFRIGLNDGTAIDFGFILK
jgi:hypothetical protein